MTSFDGLVGMATFLGSALEIVLAVKGGVDGGAGTALIGIGGTACFTGAAAGVATGLSAGCAFAAGSCVFEWEPAGADVSFEAALEAGLGILDTTGFFTGTTTDLDLEGTDTGFLAADDGATFLATGLAILLAAGTFLANLLPPDDWAGLVAAFLAGTIFLTLVGFLAGFAAFFLVAIQLGFFSDKHF
jgi:hypothetical protein